MATRTVTGLLTNASGTPLTSKTVTFRLSAPAVIASTQEIATTEVTTTTDSSTGVWSIALEANPDLTPPTTFYRGSAGNDWGCIAVVPSGVGSLKIEDCMAAAPVPAPPAALDSQVVHLALAETITGVKHFSAAPIFDAGFSVSAGTVTFSTAPTFSLGANFPSGAGVVFFGAGDDVTYFVPGTAYEMDARQGTAGAPITVGAGPTFKISRTESITEASMPAGIGANNQGNAGLWVAAQGDANNEAQVSGLLGTAQSASTQSTHNDDACGVQGQGNITGSGTGIGIGGYFNGRRSTATGGANGVEIRCSNYTATDDPFVTNGPSKTMGLWLTAGGNSPSAAASTVGTFGGQPWHVGYAVMSTAVDGQAFRDESQAPTSFLINGTHATAAVAVKSGSGPVMIGEVALVNSSDLLEVDTGSTAADPLVQFRSTGSASFSVRLIGSTGSAKLFYAGASSAFFSGTAAGDTGILIGGTTKGFHLGGTVRTLTVTSDNKISHYGVTPVLQPSTTGTATGFTAGAGTAVNDASTFTGGTGATAYRISDIVLAMKQLGLMAA